MVPPELLVFTCSEFLGSFSTDGKVMFVTSSPFLKSPPPPVSQIIFGSYKDG